MMLVGLILTALVALGSCKTPLEEFAGGNLKFTGRLYNEILKDNQNSNFVFSPFSIEVILALTRAGAKGQTATEFLSALNLPNEGVTEDALRQFLPKLKSSDDNLKLLSANRMFLGKDLQISKPFKSLAVSTFDAGIENVDFSQSTQAANTINQWVEERTNNKIKNLIAADSLNDLTRLVLVNALYFSGKWDIPFEPRTRKEKFYLSNTQAKEVDMMFVEDSFKYFESPQLNAKFIELPYIGDNISMTIVLPNEREGLSAIENNLEAALAPQNLEWQRVSVKLPSFLVESDLKLKPILKRLGLTTIFSDGADLSGISNEPLKVDDVIQKAFINVTTSGTEAAAATAVLISKKSATVGPRQLFHADHPFVYFITFDDMVLFSGKVVV